MILNSSLILALLLCQLSLNTTITNSHEIPNTTDRRSDSEGASNETNRESDSPEIPTIIDVSECTEEAIRSKYSEYNIKLDICFDYSGQLQCLIYCKTKGMIFDDFRTFLGVGCETKDGKSKVKNPFNRSFKCVPENENKSHCDLTKLKGFDLNVRKDLKLRSKLYSVNRGYSFQHFPFCVPAQKAKVEYIKCERGSVLMYGRRRKEIDLYALCKTCEPIKLDDRLRFEKSERKLDLNRAITIFCIGDKEIKSDFYEIKRNSLKAFCQKEKWEVGLVDKQHNRVVYEPFEDQKVECVVPSCDIPKLASNFAYENLNKKGITNRHGHILCKGEKMKMKSDIYEINSNKLKLMCKVVAGVKNWKSKVMKGENDFVWEDFDVNKLECIAPKPVPVPLPKKIKGKKKRITKPKLGPNLILIMKKGKTSKGEITCKKGMRVKSDTFDITSNAVKVIKRHRKWKVLMKNNSRLDLRSGNIYCQSKFNAVMPLIIVLEITYLAYIAIAFGCL